MDHREVRHGVAVVLSEHITAVVQDGAEVVVVVLYHIVARLRLDHEVHPVDGDSVGSIMAVLLCIPV